MVTSASRNSVFLLFLFYFYFLIFTLKEWTLWILLLLGTLDFLLVEYHSNQVQLHMVVAAMEVVIGVEVVQEMVIVSGTVIETGINMEKRSMRRNQVVGPSVRIREMLIRKVLHAMAGMKFTSVPDMLPIFNKFCRCLFSRLKIMLNKTWF